VMYLWIKNIKLFWNCVQAERNCKAAKDRLESEFNEKLECLRERLEAGMQDKRSELEAKHSAELEQLRLELENKYCEVTLRCFVLFVLQQALFSVLYWVSLVAL